MISDSDDQHLECVEHVSFQPILLAVGETLSSDHTEETKASREP
jgi:hypothetical protein